MRQKSGVWSATREGVINEGLICCPGGCPRLSRIVQLHLAQGVGQCLKQPHPWWWAGGRAGYCPGVCAGYWAGV